MLVVLNLLNLLNLFHLRFLRRGLVVYLVLQLRVGLRLLLTVALSRP